MSIQGAEVKPDHDVIKRIVVELERLGVPKHFSGYIYLRQAILLAYRDFTIIQRITKSVYPAIAKENHTTASRVERAMRHAIESSKHLTFGGKPTNSEVISELADKLRVEDGIF